MTTQSFRIPTEQMTQLQRIEAVDAFKLAAVSSGKTVQQIAGEMDWTEHQGRRVFNNEEYYCKYSDLPRLCSVLGNTVLLQWLQVQALNYGLQERKVSVDCQTLIMRIGEIFGEASDVGKEATDAIQDGVIEPKECRRIIKELDELVNKSLDLIRDMRALERKGMEVADA